MPTARDAARPAEPARFARPLAALAAVAAAVFVYHRALGYYFAQDDFLGLARAFGLAPRLAQPWRYISNQAIWDLFRPLGVAEAWPHHLLNLSAHAACVALLFWIMSRRVAPWAALVGATFFATHPSIFSALYWVSAVGDPLARLFALLSALALLRTDRWRWLAVPLFALSLISKETLVLLPMLAMMHRGWLPQAGAGAPAGGGRADGRGPELDSSPAIDRPVLAMAILSLLYVAYFFTFAYRTYFVSQAPALASGQTTSAAYALGWGPHLWQNLLTYLGWTATFALPLVHGFGDAVDPSVYPWGVALLALWLAGLASRGLRERGWVVGGTAWLVFILPALELRNHTYHYYLYASLSGAAWCVAAAADWGLARLTVGSRRMSEARKRAGDKHPVAVPRRPGHAVAWAAAGALALLLTANGALLVRKIETMAFVLPELRADPIVDRARIARNVYQSLSAAGVHDGETLLFWSPSAASIGPRGEPLGAQSPRETYWERNVRNALLDGLAVKVMFPQVKEVRFVREYRPKPGDEEYAAYLPDGRVRVASPAEVDSILHERAAAAPDSLVAP